MIQINVTGFQKGFRSGIDFIRQRRKILIGEHDVFQITAAVFDLLLQQVDGILV